MIGHGTPTGGKFDLTINRSMKTPTSTLFILPSFTYKKSHSFQSCTRLRRICSTDAAFHTRNAQLTTYLLKRRYNRNFVNKQIRRAADIPRQLTLQTKDINKPKRIPFITTFNPSLPHISHVIKKHFDLLLSSNRCKKRFPASACCSLPTLPQPS